MIEQGPQVSWKDFDKWYHGLSREERIMGGHGQWPEGTPQVFIELNTKTTPEDILLASIFGEKLPTEEILARPDNYLEIQAEESRKRLEAHGGKLLKERVEETLASLTDRERFVMRLRFGLEDGRTRTQAQIGLEIGFSPRTVGRIERKALTKLRNPLRAKPLKDYLA